MIDGRELARESDHMIKLNPVSCGNRPISAIVWQSQIWRTEDDSQTLHYLCVWNVKIKERETKQESRVI